MDELEIESSRGKSMICSVELAHAMFDKFYGLKSEMLPSAADEIAVISGLSSIASTEYAQAGLDRSCDEKS